MLPVTFKHNQNLTEGAEVTCKESKIQILSEAGTKPAAFQDVRTRVTKSAVKNSPLVEIEKKKKKHRLPVKINPATVSLGADVGQKWALMEPR